MQGSHHSRSKMVKYGTKSMHGSKERVDTIDSSYYTFRTLENNKVSYFIPTFHPKLIKMDKTILKPKI